MFSSQRAQGVAWHGSGGSLRKDGGGKLVRLGLRGQFGTGAADRGGRMFLNPAAREGADGEEWGLRPIVARPARG